MHVPQNFVRGVDSLFPTSAILLRFLKHRLEGNRELQIARRYIAQKSVAIDVGARRGVYTWVMAREVGPAGKVVAFEPNPGTVSSLRGVFSKRRNVTIEDCALSDVSGRGVLNVPLEKGFAQDSLGHVDGRESEAACLSYDIRMARLDDFSFEDPGVISFIKIDVEGHELSVLRGATKTIMRDRPVIFIEIEQRHSLEPVATRFEFLSSLDYAAYFLGTDGIIAPIATFNLDSMQIEPIRAERRFVNMFLFVPREKPQP
jgi:FkbM family methyltransferase